jgi:hypothetical protein
MDMGCLTGALEAFAGYVAVDELYEGPDCVLSAVDNRPDKRRLYEGLAHAPSHDDIVPLLRRVQRALAARAGTLSGITTDGSSLYPEPIREVFGDVAQQICPFQVIKEWIKGVRSAVARERQRLAASKPKWKRGRPSSKEKTARRLARKSTDMQEKSSALFADRCWFGTRRRKPSARKRVLGSTRG